MQSAYNESMKQNDFHDISIHVPYVPMEALEALELAGFEAWFVGGFVRDAIMGRPTHDFDIATSAPWERSEAALQEAGFTVHRTGIKHGTVTASYNDFVLEVTTFRTDGVYSDGRHPDTVELARTIQEDLARRDFTINALAYHPKRGVFDLFGGITDIQLGTIRAVGVPEKRFTEDGLRILRGLRLASELGFSIEPETLQAMEVCKMMLQKVSNERIVHEMDRLLLGDNVHDALMQGSGVLGAVMPEIAACVSFDQHTPYHIYDVWEHTAWAVQFAPSTRLARWATLLHDIGKPAAFYREGDRGHFFGHAELSVMLAQQIMERLDLSPSFMGQVLELVRVHDHQIEPTAAAMKRALRKMDGDVDLMRTLLGIKRADALAQSELSAPRLKLVVQLEAILDEIIASEEAFTISQLAIDGHDVLALGVQAGPCIGVLLDRALDAVIEGEVINDRDALLEFLKSNEASGHGCQR